MSQDEMNPYQAPLSTEAPVLFDHDERRLATPESRFLAKLIDGLIGFVCTGPIMYFTGYFERAMTQQVSVFEIVFFTAVGFVIHYLIHGFLLATQGQTVGKMVMRIRIEDYQTSELIPMGRMVGLRDLPIMLVSLIPYVGGILSLIDSCMIFGAERRCAHDLIAKTKVVKTKVVKLNASPPPG